MDRHSSGQRSLDITVIVPTLNARRTLDATFAPLQDFVRGVVVSDGGSADGTQDRAHELGAHVVSGPSGRGGQLIRGASASASAWMLFLHADTVLDKSWRADAEAAMADPSKAAYFAFALDDASAQARRLERMVAWRARNLGLPYGDQGLLISRRLYDELGGFRDMPVMEDVDLVRRIGRARLTPLTARAVTSAEKFRRDGYAKRSAKNLLCLGLYFAGVSPAVIKRIYG
jgi:rSAM/selenodomain-associated transferase 2